MIVGGGQRLRRARRTGQYSSVIEGQMQLEAVEPAHGTFITSSLTCKTRWREMRAGSQTSREVESNGLLTTGASGVIR